MNYHSYHEATDPGEPWYMPEFQGALVPDCDCQFKH